MLGFFENEVTKYLATTRLNDLRRHYPFTRFHGSEHKIYTRKCCEDERSMSRLKLKLFLHAVGCEDQRRTRIASAMHRVTSDLVARLSKSTRHPRKDEILLDVCKAALVYLDWGVFSSMLWDIKEQSQKCAPLEWNEEMEIETSSLIVAMVSGYTELWNAMVATGMKLNLRSSFLAHPCKCQYKLVVAT